MSATEDLRRATNEPIGGSSYSDNQLEVILANNEGILDLAAAQIWQEKAAKFAALVNMQEGESRRDLSDLLSNALTMADTYKNQAASDASANPRRITIGRITRA